MNDNTYFLLLTIIALFMFSLGLAAGFSIGKRNAEINFIKGEYHWTTNTIVKFERK